MGNIGIFVDSQAAILALNSYMTTSSLVAESKQKLLRLNCLSVITLVWVPAHRDYYGNERSRRVGQEGTTLRYHQCGISQIPWKYRKWRPLYTNAADWTHIKWPVLVALIRRETGYAT
ncbi:hypothetical protein EVAR_68849_1 [Eumeta japonica]|uniref:Uncharacterized protein n=1 Tax=Eumeta variegata TaxID=151549 RepID=A0A4C2A891_EUMVA|nr:hypothetical protein EVAR_68849_1 [Eumeta japonica]